MSSWNQKIIDDNLREIKKRFINCEEKEDIVHILFTSEMYEKMEKILNGVINIEGENYIYPPAYLSNSTDKTIDDVYHQAAFNNVSNFLLEFNPTFFHCFEYLAKNGLISIHRNNDGNNVSDHFIDPINKTCFIYISSSDSENEEYELIRQFGYVYQTINNNKPFDESSILFKDTFPDYLLLSMRCYYNNDLTDSIIDELDESVKTLFTENNELIGDDKKTELKRECNALKIMSKYMTLFMLKNNYIEGSFNNVNKFISKNNVNTKSRELWNISLINYEGIDHAKEHVLAKSN